MKLEATYDQLHTKTARTQKIQLALDQPQKTKNSNEEPVHTAKTSNPTFPVQSPIKKTELTQEIPTRIKDSRN